MGAGDVVMAVGFTSVVIVIGRYAFPPQYPSNELDIIKSKLAVINEIMIEGNEQTLQETPQDLILNFTLMKTAMETNISNISSSLFNEQTILKSDVMALWTLFNQTMVDVNVTLQTLHGALSVHDNQTELLSIKLIELSTNQIELSTNQTELSTNQKGLSTNQIETNNTQRELVKQVTSILETKQQTPSSADYSWKDIVVAVICGLLLELPVTILVIKFCFSPFGDDSDQPHAKDVPGKELKREKSGTLRICSKEKET